MESETKSQKKSSKKKVIKTRQKKQSELASDKPDSNPIESSEPTNKNRVEDAIQNQNIKRTFDAYIVEAQQDENWPKYLGSLQVECSLLSPYNQDKNFKLKISITTSSILQICVQFQ